MLQLEQTLKTALGAAIQHVFGAVVPAAQLALQPTRKEFAGSFTLVTFPFTKTLGQGPEQIGQALGEWLVANAPAVRGFNVVKGFLNLEIAETEWLRVFGELRQLPAGYWGMLLAHAGVGVFIAGVTLVNSQETMRELPMRPGEAVTVDGYTFRFDGVVPVVGPNYEALRGIMTVHRDGRLLTSLATERRIYRSQDMPTTEAAIDTGFTRDLYVAIGEAAGANTWGVRIYVKPFVKWIWAGCGLMALGGLVAVCDRRYRSRRRATYGPYDAVLPGSPLPSHGRAVGAEGVAAQVATATYVEPLPSPPALLPRAGEGSFQRDRLSP